MNNDRLQENLVQARADLRYAQRFLADARGLRSGLERVGERMFLRALDRAWEAQCMAGNGWGQ